MIRSGAQRDAVANAVEDGIADFLGALIGNAFVRYAIELSIAQDRGITASTRTFDKLERFAVLYSAILGDFSDADF